MNFITKKFNQFKISIECRKLGLHNFEVNSDGTVDVDGDVDLRARELKKLPIKFGTVRGVFDCGYNQLTTLEGAPEKVEGNFICDGNCLSNLVGGPKIVERTYSCSYNDMTSLEGAPTEVENFVCKVNLLTSLKGSPKQINGTFDCSYNNLFSLKDGPEKIGGTFRCSGNHLKTLLGGPSEATDYLCSGNSLSNLEGSPSKIRGSFDCSKNPLTSLEGAPKKVGGRFTFLSSTVKFDHLPGEIREFQHYIKYLLRWQDDYGIWQGGKFNQYRFSELLKDFEIDFPDDGSDSDGGEFIYEW